MSHRRFLLVLLAATSSAALAVGCSDDDAPANSETGPDLTVVEAGPPDHDSGGEVNDAGVDAGATACSPSLTLDPMVLASGYCVVYRAPLAEAPTSFHVDGDRVWTYKIDKGTTPLEGAVQQRTVDIATGLLGSPAAVFSFTAATSDPAEMVFPSAFLARSSGGMLAVGYSDSSFTGEVFWGSPGGGTPPKAVAQASNYDALFLDDDTLLINGTGIGAVSDGQGVYVVQEGQEPWRLIKELGEASGHLALGESVLFAGGAFGSSFENRIYGIALAEIEAAIGSKTALSATADGTLIISAAFIPDATAVGDNLVAGPADPTTFQFQEVQQIEVQVSGSTVSTAGVQTVVEPSGGVDVIQLSGGGGRLGLMLGAEGQVEVAVIQPR